MNDFTKEELIIILDMMLGAYSVSLNGHELKSDKIKEMIDNYHQDTFNSKKIAESHLNEASSLISHAMCLLGMKDE